MTAVAFDTLRLARKLEAAGFPAKQAADTAEALADAFVPELATKGDLEAVRLSLEHRVELAKRDLTIRLGGMLVAVTGILLAALRFWGPG